MPIYEYVCQSCGHELEVIQKISDSLLKVCPSCDKARLTKKVSAGAFRLSGSGWYETDFKTGNKRNLTGDSKESSADGGKQSDGGKQNSGETTPKKADNKTGGESKSPSKESSTGS